MTDTGRGVEGSAEGLVASRAWRRSGHWQLSGSFPAKAPLDFPIFSSILKAGACPVPQAAHCRQGQEGHALVRVKGELEGTR